MVTNGAGFLAQLFDFVFFRTTLRRTDFTFFREFSNETNLGPIVLRAVTEHPFVVLLWLILMGFALVWIRTYKLQAVQRAVSSCVNGSFFWQPDCWFVLDGRTCQ